MNISLKEQTHVQQQLVMHILLLPMITQLRNVKVDVAHVQLFLQTDNTIALPALWDISPYHQNLDNVTQLMI